MRTRQTDTVFINGCLCTKKPKPIWLIKLTTKDFTSFISIDLQMSWATIYIKGKEGFEKEVLHKLERSGFSFLPGSEEVEKNVSLYWINDQSSLRAFKKAITAKIIFEYRLRFFTSLEDLHRSHSVNLKLTPKEEALIKKMSDWQIAYNRELRNSA